MDILAALAADPTLLPLWAVMLFAAGMYPIGMMFGCSPCCGECPCPAGTLPDTVTLNIDGFADGTTPSKWLCPLTFESCYGSGAEARVTAPGGNKDTDAGPITKIELLDGGSGYAQLGRVAPTLTITGSGTGATFTPTLSQSQDECGRDLWTIASIAVTGGTGYTDGESLTITAAEGDTQVESAAAKLSIGKSKPELTLPGNATGTVNTVANGNGTWSVSSVSVTDGGSGYEEGESIVFGKAADDVTLVNADAVAQVVHDEPQNVVFDIYTAGGSGAVLEPVWELTDTPGHLPAHFKVYKLASVNVINGGSGYADYESIFIDFLTGEDGAVEAPALIDTDVVAAGGVIQQIYVADEVTLEPGPAGLYRGSRTGELESVQINSGGSYYKDDPDARTVNVTSGGTFYREDASVPAYTNVTVGIAQIAPSDGAGAVITATVDDNPESEDFGKITGLTIGKETAYGKPELTLSAAGGAGGQLSVYYRKYTDAANAGYWGIAGVNVLNGGSGYTDNTAATVTLGPDDEARPGHVAPDIRIRANAAGVITDIEFASAPSGTPASHGAYRRVIDQIGGDGYLAYEWCESYLSGISVVLTREGCNYGKPDCGRSFSMQYRGPSTPPRVVIETDCKTFELEATENVTNCSEMSFTAADEEGRSVTVAAGGEAIATTCNDCTGHVIVNGVEVPIGPFFLSNAPGAAPWVLICADKSPVISGNKWWLTYAAAQAMYECRLGPEGPNGELPSHEIGIWLSVAVLGVANLSGPFPPYLGNSEQESEERLAEIMAAHGVLTVGDTRVIDPVFAPYNFISIGELGSGVPGVGIESRFCGPVRGEQCVGDEWQLFSVFDIDLPFEGLPYPRNEFPPCFDVLFAATRNFEKGNIQCGPI